MAETRTAFAGLRQAAKDYLNAQAKSQRWLAAAAGIDQPLLNKFLTGKLTELPDRAARLLAGAIGADLDALPPDPDPDAPADTGPIVLLRVPQIERSTLNPRKTFDADALAELAESIDAHGLLQNLVVRANPVSQWDYGEPTYELLGGERRYRAILLLYEQDRWPEDQRVPCRVVTAFDDADARVLALLENLQREDVAPLEEGAAFQSLVDAGWSTERIAGAIKRSRRHVQLRLALVGNLAEPARKALAAGTISLAHARELATVSPDLQKEGLKELTGGGYSMVRTADQLRNYLRRDFVPAGTALLPPPDDCTGLITVDGELYFDSRSSFKAWQDEAVKRRKASLEDQWAWVDVLSDSEWRYEMNRHEAYQVDDFGAFIRRDAERGGGAVMVVEFYTGAVNVHEGLLREPAFEQPAAGPAIERPVDRNAERAAIQQKCRALAPRLAAGMAQDWRHGVRALVYGAFADWNAPGIHVQWDSALTRADILAIAPELTSKLGDTPEDEQLVWIDHAAAWTAIGALEDDPLLALLAALLAEAIGIRWDVDPADDPLIAAFAACRGIDLNAPATEEAA